MTISLAKELQKMTSILKKKRLNQLIYQEYDMKKKDIKSVTLTIKDLREVLN